MRAWIGLVVLLAATPARADDEWGRGVSEDIKAKADALYNEGNDLFGQQAYGPALEKYQAAVALWDHPAIRLNLAITEIRLDRILAATDDLEAALRFGPAPFKPEQYQRALDDQKLVGGRVGNLEAECRQPGAAIALDGKPWFSGPGAKTVRLLAGEHVVVAEAKGRLTVSRRVVVPGGATTRETIELVSLESVVKLEYPSPRWQTWTATGIGAAIGIGGLAFWIAGTHNIDGYNSQFEKVCATGCSAGLDANPVEQQLADQRSRAELEGKIGVTMLITGSVVAAGGVVWTVLNRPRRVLPAIDAAPARGGASATLTWRF